MNKPAPTLVEIRGLPVPRHDRPIFRGVDLDRRQGQLSAIMRPSNARKTTLPKLIDAQRALNAGRVSVGDQNVHRSHCAELYQLRQRRGMLFQSGVPRAGLSLDEPVVARRARWAADLFLGAGRVAGT